jgi:glycosyltransferase involved in cell wall biosynthesis
MGKIRILHCLETIGSGGVEQLRFNLAKYLDRDRFEQKIVCTWAVGVLPEKFEALGVPVISIGDMTSPVHFSQYRKVGEIIRGFRPHIIHGAVFEGVILGTVAGRLWRVPAIIMEETADPADRTWKGNMLMRACALLSNKVIAVSGAVGDYVRNDLHTREPKLVVIPNGVDLPVKPGPAVTDALMASLGILPGDFVVGSVGRLFDGHKKFSDLIRAVALLKERIPRLKLLIVGDGQDRGALLTLSENLNVTSRVIFAGYQGDTAPYYACMDVFALASQREAFGIVLVEAMFFGLPVVATAVGGIRNVVVDGQTGLLVAKNDPAAIAEAIHSVYMDPGRGEALGRAGYQRAEAEFGIARYVQRITDLYTALEKKRRS